MKFKKDFLSLADLTAESLSDILILARELKKKPMRSALRGKTVGLIFQKPSTRTAVSFAVGVTQLGGQPLLLNADVLQIKRGESPKDTGRVLSRYLNGIVIRGDRHEDVLEMARYATIPVINGLTNQEHPCQVLADLLTIMEHLKLPNPKALKGVRMTYLGDGNNVANSLILAAALLGMKLNIACPSGYEPRPAVLDSAVSLLKKTGGVVTVMADPVSASQGAQALYTDVWTSMGQETEKEKRRLVFSPYQLNEVLLSVADPKALVMHCLPAYRGEEISEGAMEGSHSVIFDQAENRLHVQKAILLRLLDSRRRAA